MPISYQFYWMGPMKYQQFNIYCFFLSKMFIYKRQLHSSCIHWLMVLCKIWDLETERWDVISASRCLYLCSVLVFDQTIDNQFRSFVQYLKVRLNRGEGGTWSTRWRTVSHKTNAAELIVLVLPVQSPWAWEQTSLSITNIRWMSRKWRKFGNRGRKQPGRNCIQHWEFLL